MGKVLIGIGAVVAASAVVVAALYFKGDLFHRSPPARQSHWVVAPPRPRSGNRARAMAQYSLTKEFGPWRLTCTQQATQQATTPKVGFIQNLGIVPSGKGKPLPCQVSIRMQDEAAPGQTMSLGFRYRAGSANPDVFAFYMTLGRPNVLYTPTGQVVDLDKKQKMKGGSYMGQFASRNPGYQEAQAQEIHLQLAHQNFTLPTMHCVRGHCLAHYMEADVGGIAPGAKIVVRLPGPPHGKPRDVDVPSQGLDSALAELRRLSQS